MILLIVDHYTRDDDLECQWIGMRMNTHTCTQYTAAKGEGKEKAPAKPKPVKEEVQVETPIITAAAIDEAVKPARKKAPPKGSAKNEAT